MLAVLGSTPQALATAAAAAVHAGQPVAVQRSELSERVLASPGAPVRVTMPDGDEHSVELVLLEDGMSPEAFLLFTTPQALHGPDASLAARSAAPVLYAPAAFAGWRALTRQRPPQAAGTGALAGFPAVGDPHPGHVVVRGIKRGLPCGADDLPSARSLCEQFGAWLPGLSPQRALEAELSSTNVLLHGPLLVGHIAQLADPEQEPAPFYRGPAFRAGVPLVLAVDAERRDLGKRLGLALAPVEELARRFYGEQGMRGDTLSQLIESFPGFAKSLAPDRFVHRYLLDDVVYGLACWEALAARLQVPTPAISAVVTVLELTSGMPLRAKADELAELLAPAQGVTRG